MWFKIDKNYEFYNVVENEFEKNTSYKKWRPNIDLIWVPLNALLYVIQNENINVI